MLDVALKNLWARKTRTILTILGIVVCLQLYLIVTWIVDASTEDMQKQVNTFAGKIFVQAKAVTGYAGAQEFPPTSSSFRESTAQQILSRKDIDAQRSSGLLFLPLAPPLYPGAPPEVLVVGVTPGHEQAYVGDIKAASGRNTLGSHTHEVVLGQGAAWHYAGEKGQDTLRPGDEIEIRGEKFVVAGVLEEGPQLFSFSALMPLSTAQRLFHREDTVAAVVITAQRIEEVPSIAEALEAEFPALQISDQGELAKNGEKVLASGRQFFGMISSTVMGVAIVLVLIVMFMAVSERTKEIGTLRAIGAGRPTILGLLVVEALILSLIAGVLGVPLAMLILRIVFGVPWQLASNLWLSAVLAAVIIGAIGSLWPAWRATRVNPLEALHYE